MVEREEVGSLGEVDPDGVIGALRGIVFRQLRAKAPSLHANHGIQLRIEIGLAAEDLGRDLVLLERSTGMIEGMLGKIAKQLAERFGAVQRMAAGKPFYLSKFLSAVGHLDSCYIHVTRG